MTDHQNFDDRDAETHKLDPRVWAPLRVCPQCSLAWESTGSWCPSCGTAFDLRERETRVNAEQNVTRVMPGRTGEQASARTPRPRRGTQSQAGRGNTAERRVAHGHGGRGNATASNQVASGGRSNGALKLIATIVAFSLAIVLAFAIGQETRASKEEVDAQIAEAVEQTKSSAVASFRRSFEEQRDRLQTEFNQRVKAAEESARQQGRADAEAQNSGGGVVDRLEKCLKNFLLDC